MNKLIMHPADFRITDTIRSMQKITLLVARKFNRWTGGTIPFNKAEKLIAKLDRQYGILASEEHQRTLREKGLARCRLIMGFDGAIDNQRLWWIMLVSDTGTGSVVEQEELHLATDKRNRIKVMGYELVHYPKPRFPGAEDSRNGPTWTWRVPADHWKEHREHLIALARHQSVRQAQKAVDDEYKRPGFRGLREQRMELFRAMEKAREPLVANGAEPIVFRKHLPHLRILRQGDEHTLTIKELMTLEMEARPTSQRL